MNILNFIESDMDTDWITMKESMSAVLNKMTIVLLSVRYLSLYI